MREKIRREKQEIQEIAISRAEPQEDEKQCLHCKKKKSLLAFPPYKGKIVERRNICWECEQWKRQERHHRVTIKRNAQEYQANQQQAKQQEWERKIVLRQAYEQSQREREQWYLQQPERCCRACRQNLPASAFGGITSASGFSLYVRCMHCHTALRERQQLACCICEEKIPRRAFIASYNGYALCGNGAWISLCCKGCELAFQALSNSQQWHYIYSCCQRAFPPGQVIYAEVDPATGDIRYVGRTSKPQRRHAQHLGDVSPIAGQWGAERTLWYTRRNWMHDLSKKGLTPFMRLLQVVEIAPRVLEWEQRYIWHGIQQGWHLLNVETIDAELVARVKAFPYDFLTAPFELLVQKNYFSSHGLAAFLHKWYK